MPRGIVPLSSQAISLLLPKLAETPQDTSLLQQKLQHAAQSGGDSKVEVSEDDADTLLDCLPAPQEGEDQTTAETRKNLSEFLQKVRNPRNNNSSSQGSKLNPMNWFK